MKTKITLAMLSVFLTAAVFAQGKTSVYAANSDISDNLDLKAVASIFGDSKDLEDFEYRLNDPNIKISNLDLNNDNMVDYLRVIEMVQDNTHLVVLQSVLQEDVYQDVATISVSKKNNRQVHVQIIGDPYMYGSNYIYEPVYFVRPVLYSNFWVNNYRPYRSYYRWNNYPTFFTYWNPYGYSHYHQNIYAHLNHNNYYNYSTNIYNTNVNNYYRKYRNNGYEQKYPNRDFKHRTSQVNKYDFDRQQGRSPQVVNSARPSKANATARAAATSRSQSAAVTTNSNEIRPTGTVKTVRPAAASNSIVRLSSSNGVRPTTTNSTVRPSTRAAVPTSNYNNVRPVNNASSVVKSPTSNYRAGLNSNAAPQRLSSSSQRTPSAQQSAPQRSSSTSAKSSRQSASSRM